jgi:hypothetical protein
MGRDHDVLSMRIELILAIGSHDDIYLAELRRKKKAVTVTGSGGPNSRHQGTFGGEFRIAYRRVSTKWQQVKYKLESV